MATDITEQDKKKFLESKGWFTWYNPNYWCHEQFGNEERDCTSWGVSLEDAYEFETNDERRNKILEIMEFKFSALKAASNLKNIIEGNQMKEQVSECCQAGINVSSGGEGTSYYICIHCNKPCFLYVKEQVGVDNDITHLRNHIDKNWDNVADDCLDNIEKEFDRLKKRETELIAELDRMQQENHILAARLEDMDRLKRLEENVKRKVINLKKLRLFCY